jgi:chromosomal replication initiation ATPase DnaA
VSASPAQASKKLHQMVYYRVNHDLTTAITSNWTEREFSLYHSRIASRLKAAVHIHISAPDVRGKIARGATL